MGVTPGIRLSETLSKHDERVMRSGQVIRKQQKKFSKKKWRGKKVKSQISKHGPGYSSGKYTAGRKDNDTDDCQIEDTKPTSSTAARSDIDIEGEEIVEAPPPDTDCCDICGHSEQDGTIGIGLGVPLPKDDGGLGWVYCEVFQMVSSIVSRD